MRAARAGAGKAPSSAYVHLPFCRRRCPYCDFAVVAPGRLRWRRGLFRALMREEARYRYGASAPPAADPSAAPQCLSCRQGSWQLRMDGARSVTWKVQTAAGASVEASGTAPPSLASFSLKATFNSTSGVARPTRRPHTEADLSIDTYGGPFN